MWISFQKVNPTLRVSWHLKIMFFGKAGLGFNPQNKFSNSFSKVPEKQPIEKSKQSVVTYFYCMKRGHSVRFCKIRKYFVPKGIMRWIP